MSPCKQNMLMKFFSCENCIKREHKNPWKCKILLTQPNCLWSILCPDRVDPSALLWLIESICWMHHQICSFLWEAKQMHDVFQGLWASLGNLQNRNWRNFPSEIALALMGHFYSTIWWEQCPLPKMGINDDLSRSKIWVRELNSLKNETIFCPFSVENSRYEIPIVSILDHANAMRRVVKRPLHKSAKWIFPSLHHKYPFFGHV